MLEILFAPICLYVYCFIGGMMFKRYIADKFKAFVIAKMAPGIIKKYLEEALGLNQDVLPEVKVVAIPTVIAPIVAPVPVIAQPDPVPHIPVV